MRQTFKGCKYKIVSLILNTEIFNYKTDIAIVLRELNNYKIDIKIKSKSASHMLCYNIECYNIEIGGPVFNRIELTLYHKGIQQLLYS